MLVAAAMRLWSIDTMSLSNDEFSSWIRSIRSPTWATMIQEGVMTDGHPPFTYSFLRLWLSIFGDSVIAIRIPFIMAGLLGLVYVYHLGRLWFSNTTALLVVALLASLAYPIYYHQVARQPAFGFLWVQAAAYYWTLFLFHNKGVAKDKWNAILWVLMAALSCYTHYFAMMAVGLMGITGLFFLNKDNYNSYLLSCIAVLASVLPIYPIIKLQYSYGGVGWIPVPKHDWLITYLQYTFNNSRAIYIAVALLVICAIGLATHFKQWRFSKFQWIGIAWFLISFLIGYLKSVYAPPILQASCLLFTYPFLLLSVFSLWQDDWHLFSKHLKVYFLAIPLLVLTAYNTAITTGYYHTEHHGEFKALARQMAEWDTLCKSDAIKIANVNGDAYWNYYWYRYQHKTVALTVYQTEMPDEILRLDSILTRAKERKLIFAWTNKYTPEEVFHVIEKYYPHLLINQSHFNSEIRLYAK